MHEYDSVLGWKNKEGNYKVAPYHPDEDEIQITYLKAGLRKSHEHQNNLRDDHPKIICVGGSFTQGWAISDDETFPWKIQKNFPSFEILNYGSGGYGTYQSLLTLEQILPVTPNPKIVIYGFIEDHEMRNVAPHYWLKRLSRLSRRGHVFVPYVTIGRDDLLHRHEPDKYPSWPFKDKSATIALAEEAFARLKTYKRANQGIRVTQKLLLQMQKLSGSYGAKLIIVILGASEESTNYYMKFLSSFGLMAIDCVYPIEAGMRVKGEGHPNGIMHSKWAECISAFINEPKKTGL